MNRVSSIYQIRESAMTQLASEESDPSSQRVRNSCSFLAFRLADELFARDTACSRDPRHTPITPIPTLPVTSGGMNLRGTIVR
jgi:chemotaxis signal transduction protein